ncbi:uncharacterized protein FFNC_15656 [Fusarium fujikuroi]|nr:uncharacterized protein FFNC_15656 [Fusarium fujikuroi]
MYIEALEDLAGRLEKG